jgi:hypothetical protein
MNVITSFFLCAKHWQIFFLLFGVFIVGEVAVMSSILATAGSPEDFGKGSLLFGAVMLPFMLGFLFWFWSMGSFLSSIVHPALRLKMGFFHFALIYPALYVVAFIAAFQSSKPALLIVIFPFHLFAMFCLFYDLYFVSKNLVLAETSKPAAFYDYAGPFFLLWFFPVGIWIVQPRVNRLYSERKNAEPTH